MFHGGSIIWFIIVSKIKILDFLIYPFSFFPGPDIPGKIN